MEFTSIYLMYGFYLTVGQFLSKPGFWLDWSDFTPLKYLSLPQSKLKLHLFPFKNLCFVRFIHPCKSVVGNPQTGLVCYDCL